MTSYDPARHPRRGWRHRCLVSVGLAPVGAVVIIFCRRCRCYTVSLWGIMACNWCPSWDTFEVMQ